MKSPSKRLMAIMDDKEKKDMARDKKRGIKEGSKQDQAIDKTYKGKSMKLGRGGRAAKLKAKLSKKGLPKKEVGGIIGKIARSKNSARGQKNYH